MLKAQYDHADAHTVCSHFAFLALLPGEWSWTCRCGRRCRRRRRTSTCEASPPRCPRHAHPHKIQLDKLNFVCVMVVGTRSRSTRSIIFALSEASLARPVPAQVQCKHKVWIIASEAVLSRWWCCLNEHHYNQSSRKTTGCFWSVQAIPRELQSGDASPGTSLAGSGGGGGNNRRPAAHPVPEINLPTELPDIAHLGSASMFSGCAIGLLANIDRRWMNDTQFL